MPDTQITHTIGRRKEAVCRVYLRPGSGKWDINGRTLGDVHRAAAIGLLLHDAGDLRLRADEENAVAAEDHVAHELLRDLQLAERLLQVDDVDPVPLREDEAAHLGIPAARLVSEVDASGEEGFDRGLSVRHEPFVWLIVGEPSTPPSTDRIRRHRTETRNA